WWASRPPGTRPESARAPGWASRPAPLSPRRGWVRRGRGRGARRALVSRPGNAAQNRERRMASDATSDEGGYRDVSNRGAEEAARRQAAIEFRRISGTGHLASRYQR